MGAEEVSDSVFAVKEFASPRANPTGKQVYQTHRFCVLDDRKYGKDTA